ncbi:MAG TPA: tryptophan synthase subunit alpha [Gemmatimonadales bacterium]|nr:tryptophan synthase subunit alpha [Gemmatimonadales bacterium]
MSESRLAPVWTALKASGRTALIPYLTAGYPTPRECGAALRAAAEVSDIIEVGVPFSDPLADGPTIQRSTFEALRQGMTLAGTLDLIAQAELARPVVVFSYLNPILRYGIDRFLTAAERLGIAGLLLTDLPAGSDPAVEGAVVRSPVDLIRLIAPTTRAERLAAAVAGAQGFIYLLARLGVTGARSSLAADLAASVARVREATALPVAVGFGISTPEQARAVGRMADGVVVGSALVDVLGREGVRGARRFLGTLRDALDHESTKGP